MYDLGQQRKVCKFHMSTASCPNRGPRDPHDFRIEYSNNSNAGPWETAGSFVGTLTREMQIFRFSLFEARYIRLFILNNLDGNFIQIDYVEFR